MARLQGRYLFFIKTLGILFSMMFSHASWALIEISANGAYYKYNNGVVAGEKSTTTVQNIGGGIAYQFIQNASIQLKYTNSKTTSEFAQKADTELYRLKRVTEFYNIGLNLNLIFAGRGSTFRPFISFGGGYMVRQSSLSGTVEDTLLNPGNQTTLNFTKEEPERSISADFGLGFRYFIAQSIALETSYNIFATDLDKDEKLFHYAATAGLRVIF